MSPYSMNDYNTSVLRALFSPSPFPQATVLRDPPMPQQRGPEIFPTNPVKPTTEIFPGSPVMNRPEIFPAQDAQLAEILRRPYTSRTPKFDPQKRALGETESEADLMLRLAGRGITPETASTPEYVKLIRDIVGAKESQSKFHKKGTLDIDEDIMPKIVFEPSDTVKEPTFHVGDLRNYLTHKEGSMRVYVPSIYFEPKEYKRQGIEKNEISKEQLPGVQQQVLRKMADMAWGGLRGVERKSLMTRGIEKEDFIDAWIRIGTGAGPHVDTEENEALARSNTARQFLESRKTKGIPFLSKDWTPGTSGSTSTLDSIRLYRMLYGETPKPGERAKAREDRKEIGERASHEDYQKRAADGIEELILDVKDLEDAAKGFEADFKKTGSLKHKLNSLTYNKLKLEKELRLAEAQGDKKKANKLQVDIARAKVKEDSLYYSSKYQSYLKELSEAQYQERKRLRDINTNR